ncbi:hypothetical protein CMK11_04910 [Candidatus Poribacteria bacterium]|nr:hypothetical protein [Candidatus Poribacteria bacterium]
MRDAMTPMWRSAFAPRPAVVALAVLYVCAAPSAWPRDGARIAFGGVTADFAVGIYVTSPEGRVFEELTEHGGHASGPAWSHDGRTIAFSDTFDGLGSRIHVMDRDGRDVREVSNAPPLSGDYVPAWSPRDDAIAFTSSREGHFRQGIYVTDLDGRETRITALDTFAKWPSWGSTGGAIAYASSHAGFLNIHVMDDEGRRQGQLTDRRRLDMFPSWHARGTAIVFASGTVEDRIGDGDIYVIAANGTGEQRLTAHPADDGDPSWSPDGAKIVFTSRRDGNGLYIMDRDGRNIRRVTDGGEFRGIEGSSWYDPDAPRSVSPVARRATMWGWLRAVDARAHRAEALRSRRP